MLRAANTSRFSAAVPACILLLQRSFSFRACLFQISVLLRFLSLLITIRNYATTVGGPADVSVLEDRNALLWRSEVSSSPCSFCPPYSEVIQSLILLKGQTRTAQRAVLLEALTSRCTFRPFNLPWWRRISFYTARTFSRQS
jgi:hypothetical protein